VNLSPEEILRSVFSEIPFQIQPVRQEASARSYYRILFDSVSARVRFMERLDANEEILKPLYQKHDLSTDSLILCIDIHDDLMNSDFTVINSHLHDRGIAVPQIYGILPDRSSLIVADVGDTDLNAALIDSMEKRNAAKTEALLSLAIDTMEQMHELDPPPVVIARSFDIEKLTYEIDFLFYHIELTLEQIALPSPDFTEIRDALRFPVERIANAVPKVFTHRDYHSRNLFPDPDRVEILHVLDFQDARMGHPFYDLASLLYDPYLRLDEELVERLLARYLSRHPDYPVSLFYDHALQRILKALGSYIYLSVEKRKSIYVPSIPSAVAILLEIEKRIELPKPFSDFLRWISEPFFPRVKAFLSEDAR